MTANVGSRPSHLTREEALRRFKASCKRKKEFVARLEEEMKSDYRKSTGKEAIYFEVW